MFALLTCKFSEQRIASAARACMSPQLWKRLHMPCVYMLTEMRAEICLRAFWTNFFLCCWLWCCISQYKGLLALQISLFDTNNVETLEGIGQGCQDQENMPKIEAPFYFGESVQRGSVCLFSLYSRMLLIELDVWGILDSFAMDQLFAVLFHWRVLKEVQHEGIMWSWNVLSNQQL